MAFSLGGVIGALLYSSFGHHAHPRGTFAVALWGAALSLVVFAIWPETGVMVAAGFAGGILLGPMNPIINLALQRRTPESMRGRAMGVVTALAYGVYPIGYVLAGDPRRDLRRRRPRSVSSPSPRCCSRCWRQWRRR